MVIILVVFFAIYMFGCGKKETALQESQSPMSMDTLTTQINQTQAVPESNTQVAQTAPVDEPKLESLPPSGPYKPTVQEIQTALKNAGLYTGVIDGKKGPMTKKAIEEFQKANGLEVDGKVGAKTWVVLSSYTNIPPSVPESVEKTTLKNR